MDIFSMLQYATVYDVETEEPICQIVGFEVMNGRIYFSATPFESEEEDPDDGVKDPIPEPTLIPLRVVSGDRAPIKG